MDGPRPDLNVLVAALLEDLRLRVPQLRNIEPSRVLVVAGEARRASRATIRPLGARPPAPRGRSRTPSARRPTPSARSTAPSTRPSGTSASLPRVRPIVKLGGRRMRYVITLRPRFFRDSTARGRVATLLHELYHAASRFDGTLHPGRRHSVLGPRFARALRPLVRGYLARCPDELLAAFGYDGEVEVLQWLERPPAWVSPSPGVGGRGPTRPTYDESHLFRASIRMLTTKAPERRRGVPEPRWH